MPGKGVEEMATQVTWRGLGGPAMLALALAAGSAAAQEVEEVPPDGGGGEIAYGDDPVYGEGSGGGGEEIVYIEDPIYEEGSDGGGETPSEEVVYDDGAVEGEEGVDGGEVVYVEADGGPVDAGCGGCEAEGLASPLGEELPLGAEATPTPVRLVAAAEEEDHDEWRFGRSPASSNACLAPEGYVAWLCEGYPQP